ncbi:MAG: AbrB/MazE/SpoVT family DNA-binding domain-containing protein [Leptolyngbyaceae bacterium]|nr:AbrB/MazE/SpoVT family DNA-binding domain-containing protein [Leptolyngbyaceae bacterium]
MTSMTVKLSSEGQISIPNVVREQLGLKAGDELSFALEGNEIRLRVLKPKKLSDFYGILPATHPFPGKEAVRQSVAEDLAGKLLSES